MSELEQAIRFFDNALDHCVVHARKPFEVAIRALCEKLERENRCDLCNFSLGAGAQANNSGDNFVLVQDENEVSICTDEKHFYTLKINFCPMCGRKLKGSDQHEKNT